MKLTIWHGAEKPIIAIGKNQCRLLEFAHSTKAWHYPAKDKATIRAIAALVKKGCMETNESGQFRFIYPR